MPHSPPIAMPNKKRVTNKTMMVGANPDSISSAENAMMFHIKVGFRP